MNGDPVPALARLSVDGAWEFGGYRYGVEPLTLPYPGTPCLSSPEAPPSYRDARRQLQKISTSDTMEDIAPVVKPEVRYWFRWITGHQVTFVVWRMLAQLLDDAAQERADPVGLTPQICTFIRAYGAMLLYSGSCSREIYHNVVRPSMRLQHQSFSGSWAPDYQPVRNLLRGRHEPFDRYPELLQQVRLLQLVHDYVAGRLVPDGKSLLRRSPVRKQDMRLLHSLYDNYFLTVRAPTSRQDVAAQLLRRLAAVMRDITANPVRLDQAQDEVQEYVEDLGGMLMRLACCSSEPLPTAVAGQPSEHLCCGRTSRL